jgi:TM2 domain-containing membrane protein YozV
MPTADSLILNQQLPVLTTAFKVPVVVKSRASEIRPLRADLIQACNNLGYVKLTECHMANAVILQNLSLDVMNTLKSEYPVPFGAFEEVQSMIKRCELKFEEAMIRAGRSDQENEQLKELQTTFHIFVNTVRSEMKNATQYALKKATKFRKVRSNALLLACPPMGLFGLHHFYLGNHAFGILSMLTCWTVIVPVLNVIIFFQLMLIDEHHFDLQHNPDYVYFKALSSLT